MTASRLMNVGFWRTGLVCLVIAAAGLGALTASCEVARPMVTASIHDVRVCQSYVGTHCDESEESLPGTAEQVHVTAALEKVEDGTRVGFEWAYVEFDRVVLDHVDVFADASRPMVASMLPRPTGGWPRGSYEVTVTTGKSGGATGASATQGFEIR